MNFSQSEIVTWRRRSCICEVPQVDTNDKEWLSSSGTFAIHSTWSRNQRKQWKCHIDGFGFPPRFEDAIFQFEHCIHPPDRDAKPRENTGVPAQMKPPHNNCWSWFMNIHTYNTTTSTVSYPYTPTTLILHTYILCTYKTIDGGIFTL